MNLRLFTIMGLQYKIKQMRLTIQRERSHRRELEQRLHVERRGHRSEVERLSSALQLAREESVRANGALRTSQNELKYFSNEYWRMKRECRCHRHSKQEA